MTRMSKEELEELQDAGSWEEDGAIAQPRGKAPRAIVSVAFPREDFERVTAQAKLAGMKTSEFIRQAALEKASPQLRESRVLAVSGYVTSSHTTVSTQRGAKAEVTCAEPLTYSTT
ncbi:MAG: hypothetical protein M3Z20_04655 [Chloroflexota bacterium]|nr:hypothetical protein [Chloroflexota bacterium]